MRKTKTMLCRRLAVLFCTLLLFCGILPVTAFADDAVVTSGSMYSYFQTFGSNGQWKDIQTPSHWITGTGEVAYCLQTSKDTPYNSSYTTVDGEDYYNDYVLTGLMAILQHGYPVTNAGFTDEQARYATANAIRFFLAENYADGMPQYLNLNVNGDWIRGKSGYEELYEWALYLVDLARWGDASTGSEGNLSFSPSTLTLTEDGNGQYFTGSITVNKNTSEDYSLAYNVPDETIISGYTGTKSETLTIQIPATYEDKSYTLCAYGGHNGNVARLFFWAPSVTNQQRLMTYVLDSTDDYLEGYATIKTPAAAPKVGSIQITKTDEAGTPLAGVSFELYDEYGNLHGSGSTNSSGVISFSNLELGEYYYKETATLPGYVLDSDYHVVMLTTNGQVAKVTVKNNREGGNVTVIKTDSKTGAALPGVHFQLTNESSDVVAEGDTGMDGKLILSGIALGSYTLKETATVNGYVLDSTGRPVTLSTNGQTVEVRVPNDPAIGSIVVIKTDAETGEPLSGVHFKLTDPGGNTVADGNTDIDGKLTFAGIALGSYLLEETAAAEGYVLDKTVRTVEIREHGQTVDVSVENMPIRGSLEIVKKDAYEDIALMGAGFRLYDSDGQQVAEGYTNAQGKLSFSDLPRGNYSYQEFKAPKGYVLDESVHTASVTEAGRTVTKTVSDTRRSGTLIIKKQDTDGSPLAGAAFLLEYSIDDGSTWHSVFYRVGNEVTKGGCTTLGLTEGQLTTGADGTATFTGLRADGTTLYRLTETKAPPGRTLLGSSVLVGSLPVQSANIYAEDTEVFDAKAFHYTITVTATDDTQYRLPEAGGAGFALLPVTMAAMATPIIIIKTKKERTE